MTRDGNEDDDRRAFLKTCGRFAAVTPPVMTLLLSTSLTSTAIARSGGQTVATLGNDRGQSFFDDRPSPAASGSSGGGSSGGAGGGGSSGGRRGGSSGPGGPAGGGAGSGRTAGGKGPFATGANSGNPTAYGGVDCADEEDEERRYKPDCERVATRLSSATRSEH